uniref:Uncharacterized protein n=1 Tax=Brassica oleracea var. oleracea TaxID=109376 RepID=A0A0D3B0N0_BRAOL
FLKQFLSTEISRYSLRKQGFAVGRSASETGIRGVEKLNIANDESILLCWKWFPVVLYRSDSVECTADMERVLRPSPSSHREVIVFDRRQILRHIFSSLSPSGRYDGIRRRWKRGSFLEASTDRERYLSDLIQERQKLASLSDLDIYEPGSPFRSLGPALTNGKLHFELATHCRVFTLLKVAPKASGQEGTTEGVRGSEWYAKGRESKSALEPNSKRAKT